MEATRVQGSIKRALAAVCLVAIGFGLGATVAPVSAANDDLGAIVSELKTMNRTLHNIQKYQP